MPVFEVAAAILDILCEADEELQAGVVAPLIRAARETRDVEGHDLSGRLFHTLLTDAKFTGAYYTSVAAATLLARLTFERWPAGVDWSDHELPGSLNVADLACGTGTLLMAVAAEAQRRHEAAGGRRAAELHKAMVEQALHGFDVQLSAVHFAATSLAMLNPQIQFDKMNLYTMPLGGAGGDVRLGSLEFLGGDEAPVQMSLGGGALGVAGQDAERVSGSGGRGAAEGETATLPELDLAIMNPPFTRSDKLMFGRLPAGERKAIQSELSARLESRSATVTAGLGAAFVAAAAPKLRPGEGRMALVLPLTVCTGQSWRQTRELIERDFLLDAVITSHDPERWNFSDSTDLSEALLIATRKPENDETTDHQTTFVNLWRNSELVVDAHHMAREIARTGGAQMAGAGTALLNVGGQAAGEVLSVPAADGDGSAWLGVQFARADLVRAASSLLADGELRIAGTGSTGGISLCALETLGAIGPDRRRLIDGFVRTDSVTAYPMVEGHDTNERVAISTTPNKWLAPLVKPLGGQRPGYGERLFQQAGRLLIAERLWLNSARVVAMRVNRPVLSNVYWEFKVDDESHERALALWLNSSLGLLSLFAIRTTTRGPWVALKKADLAAMPILDVRELAREQLDAFDALFDEVAGYEFLRLPEMAEDAARAALDDGVAEILGLPDLGALRRLLASEPVVSNRRL